MSAVPAFAKINLDLRVLYKRPDQFHELRTIFQTISLADRLDIRFTPSRRTSIHVTSNVEIADNLVIRATEACLRASGRVEIHLEKNIPIGAGLGGGSSDAAAVLVALPVLSGTNLAPERMMEIAAELGSDVPFFLLGGTAVALGRGAELYPVADAPPPRYALLLTPDIHVSTAGAYQALSGQLTTESLQNKMVSFQGKAWRAGGGLAGAGDPEPGINDFETVVFQQYPRLKKLKQRLLKLGAEVALMTGSGSALFAFFATRPRFEHALGSFVNEKVFPISLVSRARFRSAWRRALRPYIEEGFAWPPRSRSAR